MVATNNKWLLVVEDNPDDQLLAERAFRNSGRSEDLVVAHNGVEALEMLKERPVPALVLLDLHLPRISGVDVIIAMKDDPRLRTVPVVVLTSSDQMSDIGACYELGCSGFVRKPVDYKEFIAGIASIFDFWLGHNLTLTEFRPGPDTAEDSLGALAP